MIGERESSVAGADVVFSDDAAGTALVLKHLKDLGHTAIAHLTGVGGIAANRRRAFMAQAKKMGLPNLVFGLNQPTTEIGGYMGAKELIQSGSRFRQCSPQTTTWLPGQCPRWAKRDSKCLKTSAWSAMTTLQLLRTTC